MRNSTSSANQTPIQSRRYWQLAAANLRDVRMLTFAALIIALRVVVKMFKIPLAAGLSLSFDCYVNSLGSIVYGPVVGLLVGAVSDTLGCLLFPSGPYFFPFIFVEMASSFIFGLFLWQRAMTVKRVLLSKFTVNFVCNIVLTSIFMKWDYYVFYGIEKAEAYSIINMVRICKNLVMFPLEALLIVLVLQAAIPALKRLGLKSVQMADTRIDKHHYLMIAALAAVSIGLILLYVFWLKDFVSVNNIKWL